MRGIGSMNQNGVCVNNSRNVSCFLVPFYAELSNGKKNGLKNLFPDEAWDTIHKPTRYLTKYIQEIYNNTTDPICRIYQLKDVKRNAVGLPPADIPVSVNSRIVDSIPEETFSFALADITAFCYATGVGFLVLTVIHNEEEVFSKIVDKCFALSNIFTNEHDSGRRASRLDFYFEIEGKKVDFSLKNSIYALLCTEGLSDKIELFPTSARRKMNGYHRVYMKNESETDRKLLAFLSKGLHSTFIQKSTPDSMDEGRFAYSTTDHTRWDICSNGVTFLSYEQAENMTFLTGQYARNVDLDYFLVYLFALHERENLLRYNYQVVKNWTKPKVLMQMKTELMHFNVWSGYNTVSIEMSYQDFYSFLYQALEIEKLEKDVQDIIEKVNEYVAGEKDRKLNTILAAVGLLAIFSVLTDGISFVNQIYEGNAFLPGHLVIYGIIFIVLLIGIGSFFRRK